MRTHNIDDTTIEYPDEIGFCFNPVVMNIYGHAWAWVEVTVTDVLTGTAHKEKRAMFKTACFSTYRSTCSQLLMLQSLVG